jgi:hypothetical protein
MDRSIFGHCIAAALACLALCTSVRASAEAPRERCRALIAGASRSAAIAACDQAVTMHGTAEDFWAAAEVRVSRPEKPTMNDLIRADFLAAAAARLAPGEPWGALARFDLARRWGDPALTAQRLDELVRVAPNDPRTSRAIALARGRTSVFAVLGWCALLIVCALTLGHALKRRLAAPSRVRVPTALLVLVAVAALLARPTLAAAQTFAIDDRDPERGVPTPAAADARPLDFAYYLQDLSERADKASARGDHAAAARYFRTLARAVPDSSLPLAKLCDELVAQRKPDAAIDACRAALALPGVRAHDFVRFGELVLAKRTATPAELRDVESAARHLSSQPDARVLGLQLECRLGVRIASAPLLEECTHALATAAPNDASTYVFAWSLAQQKGQRDEARRLVDRARAAGLSQDGLRRMEAATSATGAPGSRRLVIAGIGLAGMLLGVLLLWHRRRIGT